MKTVSRHDSLLVQKIPDVAMVTQRFLSNNSKIKSWDY